LRRAGRTAKTRQIDDPVGSERAGIGASEQPDGQQQVGRLIPTRAQAMLDAKHRVGTNGDSKAAESTEMTDRASGSIGDVSPSSRRQRNSTTHFDSALAPIQPKGSTGQVKTLLANTLHDVLESKYRLESELSEAAQKIERQAAQLKAAEREARIDVLTLLPNRRAFDEQLQVVHSLFERHGVMYSLVLFDLDRFKAFNDTHGHAAGDSVMQTVGKILQTQWRASDRAFRYGGEEFVLVCQATDARGALIVAERICRRIEASVVCVEGKELKVTTSAGVAQIQAGMSTRWLLEQADMALYIAKQEGRNRAYAPQVDDEPIAQPSAGAVV